VIRIYWHDSGGPNFNMATTSHVKVEDLRKGKYRLTFTPAPTREVLVIETTFFKIISEQEFDK